MFGGPVMYIGLCLVGWVMLWNRPHYAFAAMYALWLLVLIVGVGAFYGGLAPFLEALAGRTLADQMQVWLGFLAVIGALPFGFLVVGSAVVAIRKWMIARAS